MTRYSRELADLLCEQLAAGRTLRSVCRDDGMPSRQAVQKWIAGDIDGFAERYEAARQLGYAAMEDEIIDLSDEAALDMAAVGKARLQVDSRKWVLAKSLPKRYGDRTIIAGDPDAPLVIEDNRPPIETFLIEFAGRSNGEIAAASHAPNIQLPVAEPVPPPEPPSRATPRRVRHAAEPEPEPPPPRVAPEPAPDRLAAFRGTGIGEVPEPFDR